MRHVFRSLTAMLFASILWAAPAVAQSVYGPGGLFINPTAKITPTGQFEPSTLVLTEHTPYADAPNGFHQSTWISSAVDYGVSPRLEVGAAIVTITNAPDAGDASVGGYAKYLLLGETVTRPALAVGATYLGGGQTGFREGFMALRKKIPHSPVTTHFGVQYADRVDGIDKHSFEPFLGVELKLLRNWSLSAEGRPRMNGENGQPLALTLVRSTPRGYQVAFTWANNGPSSTPQLGFGIGVALGSRR